MKSVYTGLYVQKFENGEIHTVQVFDTTGNSMPLNVDVYIERNIKPEISSLPTQDEFRGITSKKVILNKHCHVGTGSLLLPGAILKTGASLGAMSMVYNRKMPEWSFCSGIPEKKISDRDNIESLRLEQELLKKYPSHKNQN